MITEKQMNWLRQTAFDRAVNDIMLKAYRLTGDKYQEELCERNRSILNATWYGALAMLSDKDMESFSHSGKLKALVEKAEEDAQSDFFGKKAASIVQSYIARQTEEIGKLNEKLAQLKSEYNLTESAE